MKDHGVPFGDAMKVWARVAALSFGGPAGQIAVMHRILVDEKGHDRKAIRAASYWKRGAIAHHENLDDQG